MMRLIAFLAAIRLAVSEGAVSYRPFGDGRGHNRRLRLNSDPFWRGSLL